MKYLILFFCMILAGCSGGNKAGQSLDRLSDISRPEILLLHNIERNKNNIKQLEYDPALEENAQKWAEAMASRNNLTHSRLDLSNTDFRTMGENIAEGYDSTEDVVKGWMESPGHRRNILNKNFTHVGFGVAKRPNGPTYWCAQFGGK